MSHVFVDTSAWYALIVSKDIDHQAVSRAFLNNSLPLLTTDYVLDETVTLLQARIGHRYAVRFIDILQTSRKIELVYLSRHQIEVAIQLFCNRPDKDWSFTDCTSFVVMQDYGIELAFSLDKHFQQAGFQVQPE
jgi:predicted nucleic acid-binding protein